MGQSSDPSNGAWNDRLTGLPGRAALKEHLETVLQKQESDGTQQFALLFIGLDRFTRINGCLGHDTGDELLHAVARRLSRSVRTDVDARSQDPDRGRDVVARIGGDEFVVLLDRIKKPATPESIAERVVTELQRPLIVRGHEVHIECTVGIRIGQDQDTSADGLLSDGATALACAKRFGRGRCLVFEPAMLDGAMNRFELERDLRQALIGDQIRVDYQPIHCLLTGRIMGFEALVRWMHPERGAISPEDFIPIAEETDLIMGLGERVLREALYQQKRWSARFPERTLFMGVNLSKRQVSHPRLLAGIDQALADSGADPEQVKLEVTESTIMHNTERVVPLLHQLKQRGLRLSMDDFGTGYSSLASLHSFPIDELKIDKSFVKSLSESRGYSAIVNAIVTLAHNLDMTVIAEGIESSEQLAQLQALECDFAQGYLFSRPVNTEQATELLLQSPETGHWLQTG